MVEVARVAALSVPETRDLYVDMAFVRANLHLFQQLGTEWACRSCMDSMAAGRMPPLAAMNGLGAPWTRLPPALLKFSTEELELLALLQVFGPVDGLEEGVVGQGLPSKSLYVPLPGITSVPRLSAVTRSPEEVLALHARPPGLLPVLRPTRVLGGLERLLNSNPKYLATPTELALDEMDRVLVEVDSELERLVVEGAAPLLNHFTRTGPRLATLHGLVLPWERADLSPAAASLLAVPGVMAQIAGVFDLEEEAMVEQVREVPVSLLQWAQSRLGHAHRGGLGNHASLVLALLFLYDSQRMNNLVVTGRARQAAGEGGGEESWLVSHPGSASFMARVEEEMLAMVDWFGPPCWFVTFSTNSSTPDVMGTWLVHLAGRAGEALQVWHQVDEVARLTPRLGQASQGPAADHWSADQYFVHEEGGEEEGGCPYHTHCSRTPLEDWRAR